MNILRIPVFFVFDKMKGFFASFLDCKSPGKGIRVNRAVLIELAD